MKNNFLRLTLSLLVMTAILLSIQYTVGSVIQVNLYYSVVQIYLFHFSLAFITCSLLMYFSSLDKSKAGFVFVACSLLKMLATVIFMLPMMMRLKVDMFANVMMILIPYLIYLGFETVYVYKLLNKN
ncbi:DUF6168 family protein [Mesonia aestuariivivens]|uniref:Uncharacterized protein n=1 Tax=Mesonia aestuariivivens TaxID=2796128 RepID=A0ABS6VX55_9FLAO|nr:DUF6168 family protein [Mesonia aestuariivivens]MBW2960189.1 hypothetical protein [Mesonia aestuariivivens]